MRAPSSFLALALLSCASARQPASDEASPGLVFPAHFAEGDNPNAKERRASPSAEPSAAARVDQSSPPDPEPLRQARQYEYEVVYAQGNVRVSGVRALSFPQPVVTPRRMGRFAIELWIGRELLERVRFDFPLTGADEPPAAGPRPLGAPPSFAKGVTATQKVLVPAAERARRAVLVDRATGSVTELPWPPDRPSVPAAPPDAGPSDAGDG